ncbi:hypothetical protein [Amycolatopsis sp. NPDC000740]|uniref:hypothetical protein n=1 Tax=Amycolatopsis sp. NPDC000740 TaxID=3154269 RepID=UPI00331DFBF7
MAVASFVLACLALVISGASLAWQVTVWWKAVALVVVRLDEADDYCGDDEEHRVIVVAINVGRVATTINEVGLEFHDVSDPANETMISGFARLAESGAKDFPKRLEPGEEFQTSFTTGQDWRNLITGQVAKKVTARGYVRAGLEIVQSPYSIKLRTPFD